MQIYQSNLNALKQIISWAKKVLEHGKEGRVQQSCVRTFFALIRAVLNTLKKESKDVSYIELMLDSPASAKYNIAPVEK